MKPRSLLVAAVLLVALSGAVWWSKRHPEAAQSSTTNTPASPKLADIPSAQIKSLTLKKKDGVHSRSQQDEGQVDHRCSRSIPSGSGCGHQHDLFSEPGNGGQRSRR